MADANGGRGTRAVESPAVPTRRRATTESTRAATARAVATIASAVALLSPAAALGSPEESASREADAHIARGLELRRNADDRGALPEFEKAYELVRTPRAAAQLGLVEQGLGRWNDAEVHLAEAIRARSDPWVEKNRATLQQALQRVGDHVGTVEITGEPAGAEVIVNGRHVGRLPLADTVRVIEGTVDVEVRSPGYGRHAQKLAVGAHQYVPLVVRLTPLAGRADATAARSSAGGAAETDARAFATKPPSDGAHGSSSVRPLIGWTLAAVGPATVVAGVLVALAGQSAMDRAVADAGRANQVNDAKLYADAAERFSSANSQRTVGRVVVAAGVVVAIGGVVLALTAGSAEHSDRQAAPTAARARGVRPWLASVDGPPVLGASFAGVWP